MERVNRFFSMDESAWPLVRVRYHAKPTIEELDESLERLDAMYQRDGWRVLIIEVDAGVTLDAALRRRQADWMTRQRATIQRGCAGIAFVLPSRLLRGMLTAILWIQPLPAPHRVVGTTEEAETWCHARLAEATRSG